MQIHPLPWKALLLAPLASIPVIVLLGLGTSDAGIGYDFVAGMFFGVVLLPLPYLAMLIVGLPAYLLLRGLDLVRLWTSCAVGLVVPLAFFNDAPFLTTLAATGSGLAVSATAYWLARRAA